MPELPHTIGLIAAVHDELRPILTGFRFKRRGRLYHGQLGGKRVVAMVAGVGPTRATQALEHLVKDHSAAHVFHIGFAGGLDPMLTVGDVPTIRWVIDEHSQMMELTDRGPVWALADANRATDQTLLTSDRLVDSVVAKRQLFKRHRAAVVDMEAFAVTQGAAKLGVRLTALRAVSDPANMALRSNVLSWVKTNGARNRIAAILCLARRPWHLAAMMRLQRNACVAAQSLARRLVTVLSEDPIPIPQVEPVV